ncbi:hypothetical protein BJX99DRAFT_4973 [Aspergillus californicus]
MINNGLDQVNTPPSDDSMMPGGFVASRERLSSADSWPSPSRKSLYNKRIPAKTAKQRRKGRKGTNRETTSTIAAPLSELTAHLENVPLKDMEAHVNRSTEQRRQEAIKKGKVARPMNSFMLYRSAYAPRTQAWFSQNNHQVVSEVAGQSWARETDEIKNKYNLLASIEKQNHMKAHPNYKFTPTKDNKKKRAGLDDDRAFGDYRGGSPALYHASTFSSSDVDSSGYYSNRSTPFDDMDHHGLPNEGYFNPGSSWPPTSNPSHMSPQLGGMVLSPEPSQYAQPTSNPNLMGYVEDIRLRRPGMDGMQYASSSTLSGLPGGAHHDLLGTHAHMPEGGQLDPQLLEYPGVPGVDAGSQLYGAPHYLWQESADNAYMPVNNSMSPSPNPYTGQSSFQQAPQPSWAPQEGHEAGGDFDLYINHPSQGY